MNVVTVHPRGGDRFHIRIRGHQVVVDQSIADGGTDAGPTPTELFVASLAGCVAHYARRYLVRHGLPQTGLSVTAAYEMAARPARVGSVRVELRLPDDMAAQQREALLAVARHCTVHNTLVIAPEVTIEITPEAGVPHR